MYWRGDQGGDVSSVGEGRTAAGADGSCLPFTCTACMRSNGVRMSKQAERRVARAVHVQRGWDRRLGETGSMVRQILLCIMTSR